LIGPREYPVSPIVGVGAVVFQADCVLLVRRAKAPLAGEWSLPGGAVELGETLEQAIRREVAEETGLTVAVVKVLEALDHIEQDASGRIRFHYVLVDFLCSVRFADGHGQQAGKCELHPATDVSDAQWAAVEGLRTSKEFPLRSRTLDVIFAGWKEAQKDGISAS